MCMCGVGVIISRILGGEEGGGGRGEERARRGGNKGSEGCAAVILILYYIVCMYNQRRDTLQIKQSRTAATHTPAQHSTRHQSDRDVSSLH